MFLNIIPSIKFKQPFLMLLLVALNMLHSAIAQPIEQPVIVFAVTDCQKAYLIRLFESGKIEYRGAYGVKTMGKREAQISSQVVKEVLKKFEEAGSFSVEDDRIRLPLLTENATGGIREAIYLHQGNKTATFLDSGNFFSSVMPERSKPNPLFSVFRGMILRKTNAEQWVTYTEVGVCLEYDIVARDRIQINKLRLIKN
jgi:hypothetical protein